MITLESVPPNVFRILRPGARYALHRIGDEHPGRWVPSGVTLPAGWEDKLDELTARALVPLLRPAESKPLGRPLGKPTSDDGRFILQACRDFGMTQRDLANSLGFHLATFSHGMHKTLPTLYREVLRAEIVRRKRGVGESMTYPMASVFLRLLGQKENLRSPQLFHLAKGDMEERGWLAEGKISDAGKAVFSEWQARAKGPSDG